jgi:VCBS repeat-containing protein
VAISVLGNDADGDGTIAANTVDLNPGTGGIQTSFTDANNNSYTVSTSGIVSFTPAANFNGTATHSYTVNDNDGATSNAATITVTVNPVNDAPVAVNDAASTS